MNNLKSNIKNSNNFKKITRCFQIHLDINVVKEMKNNRFIHNCDFDSYTTEDFDPKQHITNFNVYYGSILEQSLNKEASFEYLTTYKLFSEIIYQFVQVKSLLDEFK